MSDIILYGVNGEKLDLTAGRADGEPYGFKIMASPSIYGGPTAAVAEEVAPTGSRRGRPRHVARRVAFGIKVEAITAAALTDGLRHFARATNALVSECRFVVGDRELTCTLESAPPRPEHCDSIKTTFPTTWKAHYPYWRGLMDRAITLPIGVGGDRPPGGWAYTEAFPYDVSAPYTGIETGESGAIEFEIFNPGDVPVFPIWTFTGRMTEANMSNRTNSGAFKITGELDTGDILTVDARPLNAYPVTLNYAYQRPEWLERPRVLFPLQPGKNVIVADIRGALETESSVGYSFRPEYLHL